MLKYYIIFSLIIISILINFNINKKISDNYYIPLKYKIRENNEHYIDLNETDKYQKEVYLFAKNIMEKYNLKKIVDVGCGSGYKLIQYLGIYETTGYETEPCISFLKKKYPNRKWINSGESEINFNEKYISHCDLVISSDVIEHIREPNELINFMKKFNAKYYIISTPCREILVKYFHRDNNGPPHNLSHVREWTFNEFKLYLNDHFKIINSFLGKEQIECQWHLCINK